jgi:tRNA A-37 threonylcarbamoyl transferase component Bud32
MYIIESFNYHGKIDPIYQEPFKAYSFGASSSVYLLKKCNKIVKVYNSRLRWKNQNHNDIDQIFEKEVKLLKQYFYDVHIDTVNKMIYLPYLGESLYNNFELPSDWEKQIKDLFDDMENRNIYYPEFNLNNILVKDGIISFVDFGLAQEGNNNGDNSNNFIKMLDILNNKLKHINNKSERKILCNSYMANIRLTSKYQNNVF